LISIFFGFCSVRFGRLICKTPSLYSAAIFAWSTDPGTRVRPQKLSARPFTAMLPRLRNLAYAFHHEPVIVDVDFQSIAIDSRQVDRDQVS
jgi:hypothetical protein